MNEHMARVRVQVAIDAILDAIEWEQPPKICFVSACQLHGVVPRVTVMRDSEPTAYNDLSDPRRWIDSTRTVEFGCNKWEYLRTAIGYFRDHVWISEWDGEGGDKLPAHLRLLLDAFGVEEPAAPEVTIPAPEEDEEGEFHLIYEGYLTGSETTGRYATLEEAELAVALKSEAFSRRFPGGRGHSWAVVEVNA